MLCLLLFLFITVPQQQHPRVQQQELAGRRVELKSLKGARLFITPLVDANKPVPLIIHFHGVPWLIETHISDHLPRAALITVNLGAGSNAYRRPFEQPELFQTLIDEAAHELNLKRGWSTITLCGFSAGYGAVREILRQPKNFARVHSVLLLDGMHASYIPEGESLAAGGVIDSAGLDSFIKFAREAVAGRKTFVFSHSEIVPGTYASTTECADYVLSQLRSDNSLDSKVRRKLQPRLETHTTPDGMKQLSSVDVKGLHVRGFSGDTAPDHVDHLHVMPTWFPLLKIKR